MDSRWSAFTVVLAVLLGMASAAAGTAVAIRYLAHGGFGPQVLSGLVVIGAGMLLLGFAASELWRTVQGWALLWFLPGALLCAATGVAAGIGIACLMGESVTLRGIGV